jgi:hypothetical protein
LGVGFNLQEAIAVLVRIEAIAALSRIEAMSYAYYLFVSSLFCRSAVRRFWLRRSPCRVESDPLSTLLFSPRLSPLRRSSPDRRFFLF